MKKVFITGFILYSINFFGIGLVADDQPRKILYMHDGSKIEANTIWENLGNIHYSAGWNIGSYPLDLVDLERTFGKAKAQVIIGQMEHPTITTVKKTDSAESSALPRAEQNKSVNLVEVAKYNLLNKIKKLRQIKSSTDPDLNDFYDRKIKIIEAKIELLNNDPEFAFYAENITSD